MIYTSTLLVNWKKIMDHECHNHINWRYFDWCFCYSNRRNINGTGGLGGRSEWRPSKLQLYWERREYWEVSWRLEESCCHTNSNESPCLSWYEKLSRSKIIIIIFNWCFWYSHHRIGTMTGGHGNNGMVEDYPNTSLLRLARLIRRVLETWGHMLSLKLI